MIHWTVFVSDNFKSGDHGYTRRYLQCRCQYLRHITGSGELCYLSLQSPCKTQSPWQKNYNNHKHTHTEQQQQQQKTKCVVLIPTNFIVLFIIILCFSLFFLKLLPLPAKNRTLSYLHLFFILSTELCTHALVLKVSYQEYEKKYSWTFSVCLVLPLCPPLSKQIAM